MSEKSQSTSSPILSRSSTAITCFSNTENDLNTTTMIETLDSTFQTERDWTMRDDNHQHHHATIPRNQSPTTLTLNWKRDKQSSPTEIEKFRIDLKALTKAGYARITDEGKFFLRFQRSGSEFQIALNRSSAALTVGKFGDEISPLKEEQP